MACNKFIASALEAIRPKLRCQQGRAPSETCRGALPCLVLASGSPRHSLHGAVTPVSASCVHVVVSLRVFPSFKIRTPVILDQGPPYWPHCNLITSVKTIFPSKATFWGTGDEDFKIPFCGEHKPITVCPVASENSYFSQVPNTSTPAQLPPKSLIVPASTLSPVSHLNHINSDIII